MRQVLAFYLLYLKMLLAEKIALIWSVIFPVVIALVFQRGFLNDATDEKEIVQYISFFWAFIIISTYINGIGLQIARIREYGLLKTYVMITGNRYTFLTAILLTQISFGAISLLLFTSIVSIYYRAFSFNLLLSSLIVLLVSFPLAIASVSIAAIPIKFNNLSTIMNILVYPLFFLSLNSRSSNLLNYVNPYYIIHEITEIVINLLMGIDYTYNFYLLLLSILLYLVVGLFIIKRFNLLSLTSR
ncbi:ABC transporter permease [Heyndrickxia coagulans]|uniref:ABC transporter permease n=1 Tax=Heyndrickxia coagulans TaxID=1398 RepID=UPI001C756900|nr:ABC transporter permease [Heyndrickxia coagulans]QWU07012.1 ABC transporter permease [Heyndrickxia coagulans]UJZ87884.1 ABC transporter permease [Heyndrickxia coagulans]